MKNRTCLFACSSVTLALSAIQGVAQSVYTPYTFTTFAGLARNDGSADGTGSVARFSQPVGLAVDIMGSVYVTDTFNDTIRKVTPAGGVTTLAGLAGSPGSADGTGSDARFNFFGGFGIVPQGAGVAVDIMGNIYVADKYNHTIRKVTPAGVVTTLAGLAGMPGAVDGTGSVARFSQPSGVAVDNAGNVYVADTGNYTIRKVTPEAAVTTLAGLTGIAGATDGTGSDARFGGPEAGPTGVAVDIAGNVYVADFGNFTIRKVTPAGAVTTLAGVPGSRGSADGTGSAAWFDRPYGVAVDGAGNVYVADAHSQTIRKVTPAGGVTTLAGLAGSAGSADGTGNAVRFNFFGGFGLVPPAAGVAVDSAGNVYVTDFANSTLRKGFPALMILNSGSTFGFNDGQFGFSLTGPAGQLVVVEASTDLVNWLPLWTNTLAGALNFSDQQGGVYSNCFYRAHLP
ncbi:MAG: NHL repeat-containing protein [Limisphaerales bacterium]